MGFPQHLVFRIKNTLLLTSLLSFLASISLHDPFFTQGLPHPHHNEAIRERALIGSRPPRCAGRCNHCGQCEAIQVLVVPQKGFLTTAYSRGDGLSNYKPMSWKCKCGSSIFNP